VILYAMLFGHLPFDDKSQPKLFKNIIEANFEIDPADGVSAEAIDLINRLLQPLPCKRLSLRDAAKHPWLSNQALYELPSPIDLKLDKAVLE